MGEQLICKLNPMSDAVKKQLGQLRDQWQSLNQVAASQTRSLDGTKSLEDFNKKVEKLEAWIKDKVKKILEFYVIRDSLRLKKSHLCGKIQTFN